MPVNYNVKLNARQLELLMASVAACTPSGGGGEQHNLLQELARQTGFDLGTADHLQRTCARQELVATELQEAR